MWKANLLLLTVKALKFQIFKDSKFTSLTWLYCDFIIEMPH